MKKTTLIVCTAVALACCACQSAEKTEKTNIDYSKINVDSQTDEEIQNELVRQALPIYFRNRRESALTYSDTEQACQIIWAFVKNADDTTPVYTEWIDGFDFVLPIKDLINILYTAWNETARPTVEVKN